MAPPQPQRIPVYFMPGMAAGPSIFRDISLPEEVFKSYYLEWFVPDKGMNFKEYAARMCGMVTEPNPVLVGVSFGGCLVQEMARQLTARKVIIVSSVKKTSELPRRLRFAKSTRIHRLLPTGLVAHVELLRRYAFGERVEKRLELYEKYLSVRDKAYIDWSIEQIVNWTQDTPLQGLVHIHGEKDAVFPIKYIDECISVKNGTHTMIIHRYKWFNEHLPAIILEDRSSII